MFINFIIELFESKDKNTICTIVDKLTRERYYIVCIANNKNIFVEAIANIFLYYISSKFSICNNNIKNLLLSLEYYIQTINDFLF